MSYEINKLNTEEARTHIQDYEYALLYMISEVILTETSALSEINWDECTEARFFYTEKELHFFHQDAEMKAVEITDKDDRDEIIKTYDLANKFLNLGKKVKVKQYITYDKDGQANIALTRLVGIVR